VPRRHGQGARADEGEALGCAAADRAVASHDGCVDLWPGTGSAQSHADSHEVLPKGSRVMHQKLTAVVTQPVSFTLNGHAVVAPAGETILEAAERHGVEIPRLCYMEGMRPDGNCRTCMVEIKGERVLAPSCCRYPKDGMEITTNSARALTSQKMSIELLLSDVPERAYTLNSELDVWARKMNV